MQRRGRPQAHSSFDHVRSEAADMFLLLFLLLLRSSSAHCLQALPSEKDSPFFFCFLSSLFLQSLQTSMHIHHCFCWCLMTFPMVLCLTCIFLIVLSPGRNVLGKEGYSLKVSLASGADTRAVFKMNSLLLFKTAVRFLIEGQSVRA